MIRRQRTNNRTTVTARGVEFFDYSDKLRALIDSIPAGTVVSKSLSVVGHPSFHHPSHRERPEPTPPGLGYGDVGGVVELTATERTGGTTATRQTFQISER